MKKILLLWVLLLTIFTARGSDKLITARTVVAGRVINFDSTDQKVLAVNYCDPLSQSSKVAVRLSDDGGFHTAYDMTFGQNITIAYGNKFINLFAAPTDSIFVEIDMAKLRVGNWSGVKFTGSSCSENNELNGLVDYIYPLINVNIDKTLPPAEFIKALKTIISSLQDSVSMYAEKHNLSSQVHRWSEIDLKYIVLNYVMDYGEGRDQDRLQVFTDPMLDLYNEDNFKTMFFSSDLSEVLSVLLNSDKRFKDFIEQRNIIGASAVGVEILGALPASTTRDMLIYMFLSEIVQENADIYKNLPANIFVNKVFADRLNELSKKVSNVEVIAVPIKGVSYLNSDKLVETVKEQDVLNYLVGRYAGKVIYVDVYATWCGPCIAEFAYGEQFQNLFKGKDVVFVNLCLSSNQQKWIETISKYKIEGENYFFDNDATQLFMSTYGLSGYPSYMLISRDGKIITTKAPRPSAMTKSAEMIDNLLK